MRDINEPLRIAYAAALTQIPGVGCYYQSLPSTANPDNYIVFRSINNVDFSTKGSFEFVTNITVEIHTKSNVANRGLSADNIADQVFNLIYWSRQDNISLTRGQVYNTEVANDVTQDFRQQNQHGYISRFITFRHLIYVEASIPTATQTIMVPGAVFRIEYTGTGGEVGFVDADLQNKNLFEAVKDGVGSSKIITSGSPVDKQVLFNTLTGSVTWAIPFEPGEESYVLYQI